MRASEGPGLPGEVSDGAAGSNVVSSSAVGKLCCLIREKGSRATRFSLCSLLPALYLSGCRACGGAALGLR